jgi:hypothetical protein
MIWTALSGTTIFDPKPEPPPICDLNKLAAPQRRISKILELQM